MVSGTLIAESLRLDVAVDRVPLTVNKIVRRGTLTGLCSGQPAIWTFVEFSADETHAAELADSLAEALDPELGWYCDLHSDEETFVVFSDRTFRYARGDSRGRRLAESHARAVGLPESQIDWPD
jgi:hypothetical protein